MAYEVISGGSNLSFGEGFSKSNMAFQLNDDYYLVVNIGTENKSVWARVFFYNPAVHIYASSNREVINSNNTLYMGAAMAAADWFVVAYITEASSITIHLKLFEITGAGYGVTEIEAITITTTERVSNVRITEIGGYHILSYIEGSGSTGKLILKSYRVDTVGVPAIIPKETTIAYTKSMWLEVPFEVVMLDATHFLLTHNSNLRYVDFIDVWSINNSTAVMGLLSTRTLDSDEDGLGLCMINNQKFLGSGDTDLWSYDIDGSFTITKIDSASGHGNYLDITNIATGYYVAVSKNTAEVFSTDISFYLTKDTTEPYFFADWSANCPNAVIYKDDATFLVFSKDSYYKSFITTLNYANPPDPAGSMINIEGEWKDIDTAQILVGGVWKDVDSIDIAVGGVWKKVTI